MNLTSKRMLQFIMVCVGACAFSATAADPTVFIADSFEAPDGVADLPVAQYKQTLSAPDGNGVVTTNVVWSAAAGDASKLVADDNSAFTTAKGRPFVTGDKSLVLNLETEGQTLARTVGSPLAFGESTPVYVDTLIKFTPSEDNPVISDESVKAAVFVNVSSNLCIFHGVGLSGSAAAVATATTIAIDPTQWYRLTIKLSNMPEASLDKVFQVYLNGELIVDANGMNETYDPNGSFFYTASNESTLSTVAFQGTGKVDELVVADMANGFATVPASVLLTLAFDSAMVSVTTNGAAANTLAVVPTDTAVVITAQPWYQITDFGALFIGGSTTNKFDTMVTGISGTVSSGVTATNTIVAAQFSTTAGLPAGFGSYPITGAKGISTWALANGQNPADITTAMLDDYLLNVAPGTDAQPLIDSIVVNGSNATIKVGATNAGVDFTTINGTITIFTKDLMTDEWAEIGTFNVTLTTAQLVTITVPVGDGKFIKAVVK